jgi:hypothetical protein
MKTCVWMEIYLQAFLTLTLDGGKWRISRRPPYLRVQISWWRIVCWWTANRVFTSKWTKASAHYAAKDVNFPLLRMITSLKWLSMTGFVKVCKYLNSNARCSSVIYNSRRKERTIQHFIKVFSPRAHLTVRRGEPVECYRYSSNSAKKLLRKMQISVFNWSRVALSSECVCTHSIFKHV